MGFVTIERQAAERRLDATYGKRDRRAAGGRGWRGCESGRSRTPSGPPRQRVQDAGTSKVTGRAERSDHAVEVPIILQNVRFCLRAPCSAVTNTGRGDTDRSPALRTETSHRETLVPQGSYTLKLSPPKPMQHHLRWLGSDGARRSKAILVATLQPVQGFI